MPNNSSNYFWSQNVILSVEGALLNLDLEPKRNFYTLFDVSSNQCWDDMWQKMSRNYHFCQNGEPVRCWHGEPSNATCHLQQMPPTCFSITTEVSPQGPGFIISYYTCFLVDLLYEFCRKVTNFVYAHHHHVSGNFPMPQNWFHDLLQE